VLRPVTNRPRPMSQQTWPLSQNANKSSGLCIVCRATRQLHIKDGTIHQHGPRDDPCPGSNKPPLSMNLPDPPGQSQLSVSASGSQPVPPAQSSSNMQSVSWTPPSSPLIKHTPKSAPRPACACHLAKLLRAEMLQLGISKKLACSFKLGFLHSSRPQVARQTT